jgi:hypothetical protein
MTAYKLLVIIPYSLRSCFAPTNIFALRQMHPRNARLNELVTSKILSLFLQSAKADFVCIAANSIRREIAVETHLILSDFKDYPFALFIYYFSCNIWMPIAASQDIIGMIFLGYFD